MDPFWNQMDLPLPVIMSMKLESANPYKVVKSLKLKVAECRNSLQYLSQLDLEAATLSRLLYRMKLKFRQEKNFKYLQMINRCLTNYKTMHLPFTLTSIHDTLFDDRGPSRQMMEWLLVRFYGTAQLFHRVNLLCIEAVGHLIAKLKLGSMWDINVFCVAVASRIWVMARFVVRKSCEWFSSLQEFLDKLPSSATPWLPEGCSLPKTVYKVLENASYLKDKIINSPTDIFNHTDNQLTETQKNELNKKCFSLMDIDLEDDMGELVSRDEDDVDLHRNKFETNFTTEDRNTVSHNLLSARNPVKPLLNIQSSNKSKMKNKLKKKKFKQMNLSVKKVNGVQQLARLKNT